jgi:hypothetical protein
MGLDMLNGFSGCNSTSHVWFVIPFLLYYQIPQRLRKERKQLRYSLSSHPGISLHQIRKHIEYTFEDTEITDLSHRFSECNRVTPSGR